MAKCTPEYNDETRRLKAQRDELARVAKAAESGDFRPVIRAKSRELTAAGETDALKVIEKAHEYVNQYVPHTKEEVANAISGYGRERKPATLTEAQDRQRAVEQEIRDLSKTHDELTGKAPSPEERSQARTKAQIQAEIADLNRQIDHGVRNAQAEGKPILNPEITALREQRDALRAEADKAENPPPATKPEDRRAEQGPKTLEEAQAIAESKNRAERTRLADRLNEMNADLKRQESVPKGKRTPEWDQATKDLRAEHDRVKAEHDAMTKPGEDEEQTVKRLEKQVADLDDQLANGEKVKGRKQGPDNQRTAQLKAEVKSKRDLLNSKRDVVAKRSEARLRELAKQKAELQRQIDTNDFPKAGKKKNPEYSPEVKEAQEEVNRLRAKAQAAISRAEAAKAGPIAKTWKFLMQAFRAIIFSDPVIASKLIGAATIRIATSPMEAALGQINKNLPYLGSRIYSRTAVEGGTLAEAIERERQAVMHTLNSDAFKEAWSKLKGDSNLKALVGVEMEPEDVPFLLALPGRLHGVFKTPAEMNDFHRRLTGYAQAERRNAKASGMSDADVETHMQQPQTVAILNLKAYLKSREAIMMQDNRAAAFINQEIARLKQMGPIGQTLGGLAEYETQVKRVGLNIASETANYIPLVGAINAAMKIRETRKTTASGEKLERSDYQTRPLTPEEADKVAGIIQKQELGVIGAVAVLGWLGASAFGGYYQPGKKDKPGELSHGQIRLGDDLVVDKNLAHAPLVEALQMTADAKRAYDAAGGGSAGVFRAGEQTFSDFLNSLPFIGLHNLVDAAGDTNPNKLETFAAKTATSFVPQYFKRKAKEEDVRDIGGGQMVPVKRKPKGFIQKVEMDIPGLRKNVPTE